MSLSVCISFEVNLGERLKIGVFKINDWQFLIKETNLSESVSHLAMETINTGTICIRCEIHFKWRATTSYWFIVGRISFALIDVPWSIERFQFSLAMNRAYPGHWTSFAAYPVVRDSVQLRILLQLRSRFGHLLQHWPHHYQPLLQILQCHHLLLSSINLSGYRTLSINKCQNAFNWMNTVPIFHMQLTAKSTVALTLRLSPWTCWVAFEWWIKCLLSHPFY